MSQNLQLMSTSPMSDAQRLAGMLQDASPGRAKGFAIAMHERACAQGDDAAMQLWADIIDALNTTSGVS